MSKSKTARLLGFVGALGGSAVLIGAAVHTTGAYFTDTKNGQINTSTGTVKIDVSDTTLRFTGLLPGEDKQQTVYFRNKGSAKQDIWLALPANSPLTGEDGNTALGRYGHLQVDSVYGRLFRSYNLRSDGNPAHGCAVDGNGWGGSDQAADNLTDPPPPYCGAPHFILLQAGLSPEELGSATITFGFTKVLANGNGHGGNNQGQPELKLTDYQLVATQPGVRPDNPNNNPTS